MIARREETEEEEAAEAEGGEVESGEFSRLLTNLHIETAGTEEEAEEGLAQLLRMEGGESKGSEGEEGGGMTLRALEVLEFLTQEAEPSGTTLIDARNGVTS